MSPHEAIDRDFDAHLERIRDFLRIPSVSAHDGDLRSTADAVCELIELAGGTAAPRRPAFAGLRERALERLVEGRIRRSRGVVERGHGRRREFDTAPDRKRGPSCSSSFVTARIG